MPISHEEWNDFQFSIENLIFSRSSILDRFGKGKMMFHLRTRSFVLCSQTISWLFGSLIWNAFEIVCLPRYENTMRWCSTMKDHLLSISKMRVFPLFLYIYIYFMDHPFVSLARSNRIVNFLISLWKEGRNNEFVIIIDLFPDGSISTYRREFAPWRNCFFGLLLDVSLTGTGNSNYD